MYPRALKHQMVGGLIAAASATLLACVDPADDLADPGAPVASQESNLYEFGALWPFGSVPVCVDGFDYDQDLINRTRWILDNLGWSAVANIHFTGWGLCPAINPPGGTIHVRFVPDTNGTTNALGFSPWSETYVDIINNGTDQHFTYEVLHEFGHALGFSHEQQRPDNWPDGAGHPELYCNQNQVGEQILYGGTYRSPYFDLESIMSYCTDWRMQLSAGDVVGAQAAYGKRTPVANGQNSSNNAVARTPTNLDTFFVHSDGALWTNYWFDGMSGTSWPTWALTAASTAPANEPVATVARTPGNLDAFYVSNRGEILSSYWYSGASNWTNIVLPSTFGLARPGEQIAAVASTPGAIDVVFAGTDRNLWWSRWTGAYPWSGWSNPSRITTDGSVPLGAAVSMVARHADQLDAFFIGADGKLHTSYCYGFGRTGSGSCTAGNWLTYTTPTPANCLAPAGAGVSVSARGGDNLDVFFVAQSGAVCTAVWTPSAFWPTFPITGANLLPAGGKVASVARTPDNLDVFFMGRNAQGTGDIYDASWFSGASSWSVRDAQSIYGGNGVAGSTIAVTARQAGILDVFTMGLGLFGGNTTSQSTAYWTPQTSWKGYMTDSY